MTNPKLKKWLAIGGASVMFYSLVTSTAVALFLPKASLQKISFATGTLELKVSGHQVDYPDPDSFKFAADFPGSDTLTPGGTSHKEDFWVRNNSSVAQNLTLSGQLTVGNADWNSLKSEIEAKLSTFDHSAQSDWKSLAAWSATPSDFPGPEIPDGTQRRFEFEYRLRSTYSQDPDAGGPLQAGSPIGTELQGKATGNMTFNIDGRRL